MIEVELRRVPEGAHDYVAVARLTVDGTTVQTWDPENYLPLDLPVLVFDEDDNVQRVTIEDDPVTYARNLDTILRTGYLVPVITRDDNPTP